LRCRVRSAHTATQTPRKKMANAIILPLPTRHGKQSETPELQYSRNLKWTEKVIFFEKKIRKKSVTLHFEKINIAYRIIN